MADGISDLSYRHYGGAARTDSAWRVIAAEGVRKAFKNRAFWVLTAVSAWYYVFLIAFMYVLEQSLQAVSAGGQGGGDRVNMFTEQFFERIIWKDQFVIGIGSAQLFLVIIALIIGSGAIANDNRSNALLIYFSRPCSKWSYLFGKWMGVFTPFLVAGGLPALFFFIYGALNYRDRGFLTDDPFLILRIGGITVIMAAFYASLIVGLSSLFRQPRLAGAIFAGVYFISFMVTSLVQAALTSTDKMNESVRRLAEEATYWSVSGLMRGASKIIFDTNGSPPFGGTARASMIIPKPEIWITVLLVLLAIGLPLAAAWWRVKAVEVVK